MLRRHFHAWLGVGLATVAKSAADERKILRGRLRPGVKPALVVNDQEIPLTGDPGTLLVLADQRLSDLDLEVSGEPAGDPAAPFRVGPIHKRSMHVHQDGKRLMITYWCEVCSIRTFTPGVCMCCQDETAVDLKEKLESDDIKSR